MATITQTFTPLSGVVTEFTFAHKVTDDALLSATIDGVATTIDAVVGAAADSTYVTVTVLGALGMAGSTLVIIYDIGSTSQLSHYDGVGAITPAALEAEIGQLYDRGDALVTEIALIDTPVTGTVAVAQAAADAAQVDATDALDRALLQSPTSADNFTAESKQIKDVADPTLAQDAVTKHYFDINTGGVGGGVLVPIPADPGDDGKIAMADGGTLIWSDLIKILLKFGTLAGVQLFTESEAASEEWRIGVNCDPTTFSSAGNGTVTGIDNAKTIILFRYVVNGTNAVYEVYTAPTGFGAPADLTLVRQEGSVAGVPSIRALIGINSGVRLKSEAYSLASANGTLVAPKRQVYITPGGPYTWTHPNPGQAILVTVTMQAGGGKGIPGGPGARGGGGGAYRKVTMFVDANVTNMLVGAGGTTASGGDSQFGAYIVRGGKGGASGSAGGIADNFEALNGQDGVATIGPTPGKGGASMSGRGGSGVLVGTGGNGESGGGGGPGSVAGGNGGNGFIIIEF